MIKRVAIAIVSLIIVASFVPLIFAIKPDIGTIPAGDILYSAGHYLAGQPIPVGFDEYGYNYQGHMFMGSYFNSYSGGAGFPAYDGDDASYLAANPTAVNHWAWPYRNVQLMMQWNDAWLSNKDQDGDGKLDRHFGFASYLGSGAWLTNLQSEADETSLLWNYFTKIVAAPADAEKVGTIWYTNDGSEIGPVIWGEFATILSIYNEIGTDIHGVEYMSPTCAGLGAY